MRYVCPSIMTQFFDTWSEGSLITSSILPRRNHASRLLFRKVLPRAIIGEGYRISLWNISPHKSREHTQKFGDHLASAKNHEMCFIVMQGSTPPGLWKQMKSIWPWRNLDAEISRAERQRFGLKLKAEELLFP